jgi:iron complex outermembrane recepter protein
MQPASTRSDAVFAFAEAPLTDHVRLQTGARVEHVEMQGTPASDVPTSRNFDPTSASLGFVFDTSEKTRLGLTLSSAARAPAQTELFARGPHDGPGTYETGDPTLDVERANSLEGTLRVNADKVSFEFALWEARFDNYIFGALTGQTCDEDGNCAPGDAEELKELNYTQVDATFKGAEAQASWSLYQASSGMLQLDLLADTVRATIDSGGNVPRIPPYHVGLGLHWTGKLDGGFMWRYSAQQTRIGFAETQTPSFVSLDAHLGWRPSSARGLELALVGHNLTDTVQRNAVALNKDEVVLPGRDIRLLVRAMF